MDPFRPVDVVYRDPEVRHDAIFGVMGVPLRFQTNSSRLFTLAIEAFARFGPPTREMPLLQVRLFTHPTETPVPGQMWPLLTRAQGDYYYVTWGPGCTLVADLARGYLFGYVTPDILAWPHLIREAFLLGPVLYTLSWHEYIPLRAAVVLWRRRYPVYLVTDTEADISVLLYQAVRARWRVVAERHVMAVRTSRGYHFWGVPWWLHLPCHAIQAFPELDVSFSAPLPDGSWQLVLDIEDAWPGSTEPHAGPGPLVYVYTTPDPPAYDWMDAGELLAQVTFINPAEPTWLQDHVSDVAGYLADQGTYWLQISPDWEASLQCLEDLATRHWRA